MKILLILVGLSIGMILFREQWLFLIGDFLIVDDALQPADVIHTIAGEDYRTDYAIQLYKNGYGKTLFFTGGWCDIHLYHHGEHGQERALQNGIPVDSIAFDDSKVISTYMEAERLKQWIAHRSYPVHSIIVVSDPFHMRRIRWTYQRVFGKQMQIQMAPVPFSFTPYEHAWWKTRESQKMVRDEYSKLIYYLLRYQYSWGPLRDWLVSLDTE